jgi:hypothetical protein
MRRTPLALLLLLLLAGCTSGPPRPPWPGAAHAYGPPTTALPMLPLRVNAQGELEGVAQEMRAYDYCGHHNSTAMRADYRGEEVLRYAPGPDPEQANRTWYADRVGQPARLADFAGNATAMASWRGQGLRGSDLLVFVVGRLNRTPDLDPRLDADEVRSLMVGGLAAFSAASPLGCCILQWRSPSAVAEVRGFREQLFDTCRSVAFDPDRLVPAELPPRALAASNP